MEGYHPRSPIPDHRVVYPSLLRSGRACRSSAARASLIELAVETELQNHHVQEHAGSQQRWTGQGAQPCLVRPLRHCPGASQPFAPHGLGLKKVRGFVPGSDHVQLNGDKQHIRAGSEPRYHRRIAVNDVEDRFEIIFLHESVLPGVCDALQSPLEIFFDQKLFV
jgi:hypothetical protein